MDWYTMGADCGYNQYTVYPSERIPKLEALVNSNGKGYLQLDGRPFCDFDLNDCIMDFENYEKGRVLRRDATYEEKINKVILLGENYALTNLREMLKGRSNLLDAIIPLFSKSSFDAVRGPLPGKYRIELKIPADEKADEEIYKRAGFAKLTKRKYEVLKKANYYLDKKLFFEFPGNISRLKTVVLSIEKEIKLSNMEQNVMLDIFEDYFGESPENFLAKSLMTNPVTVEECKEISYDKEHRTLNARFSLSDKSAYEVCKRSGVLSMMDNYPMEKYSVAYLTADVTEDDIEVGIEISSNNKQIFRVPFKDTEKDVLIQAINKKLGMPYDRYLKKRNTEEQHKDKMAQKKNVRTETVSKA